MENHPSWKGGKRINHNGYVVIRNKEHHRSVNGYVFEHILVAENKYGRPITRSEDVHHIDGNKLNNHPDNLEVLSKREHAKITAESRKLKNMFPCHVCGTLVYRKPSHLKKGKGGIFCSRRCVGLWTYKNRKGVFINVQ